MERKIEGEGKVFVVTRGPSIFTNRIKREDCVIKRRNLEWGARHTDGHRYTTMARFACETGNVLRSYEALPPEITIGHLVGWGFIDHPVYTYIPDQTRPLCGQCGTSIEQPLAVSDPSIPWDAVCPGCGRHAWHQLDDSCVDVAL